MDSKQNESIPQIAQLADPPDALAFGGLPCDTQGMAFSMGTAHVGDIPTPAIVLDAATVRGNIDRLAAYAASHGIAVRPHTKTHKSVEIRADADMVGIARELADAVEVVDHHGQIAVHVSRCRFAADPSRHHHPGVEGAADHGAAVDQRLDHLVGKLPVVVDEGSAVVVARPDRPDREDRGLR